MARSSTDKAPGALARIEALPEALLADPVAFMLTEHARQRVMLGHLNRLARQPAGVVRGAIARALAGWLACELPMHLADEDVSLYPRLGADAASIIAALRAGAAALDADRRLLRADVARIAAGDLPGPDFSARAAAFATVYRGRMAEEESTLLPLAQRTLDPAGRSAVAGEIMRRRHQGQVMPEAPLIGCCDVEGDLLPPHRALECLLAATRPLGRSEVVPLHRAAGRILAQPLVAARQLPAFDHSAMDGYALHGDDLELGSPRVIRRVTAGEEAGPALRAGTAVRVLTGAPVPPGTAAVIMEEQVSLAGGRLFLAATPRPGQNIRRAGEDIAQGTPLLAAGRRLGARHVALLAALGMESVPVHALPRIGVLSVGNELLRGRIGDSNRPMLLALLVAAGAQPQDLGIVADDPALLAEALRRAAPGLDMIVSTGGIAGSDADHVAEAVIRAGGRSAVMRIAQKPGKPLGHGAIGSTRCLLLPGNPVAALVGMLTLGLPMVARIAGAASCEPRAHDATLAVPLSRKAGREEYRPARRVGTDATGLPLVEPLGEGGSAGLRPLIDADGLLHCPAAAARIEAGSRLAFLPFPAGV